MAEIKNIEDLATAAQLSNVYMVTLTTMEGGRYHHHFLSNNFPHSEMLRCHNEVEKLVVDYLKNIPSEELGQVEEPGQEDIKERLN